eukprot:g46242.t1
MIYDLRLIDAGVPQDTVTDPTAFSCFINDLLSLVIKKVDKDRAVDIVYMDFSKAFDKVLHDGLLSKSQVDRMVKKAYGMLAFASRNIEYRSWDILLQLYKTLLVFVYPGRLFPPCLSNVIFIALAAWNSVYR